MLRGGTDGMAPKIETPRGLPPGGVSQALGCRPNGDEPTATVTACATGAARAQPLAAKIEQCRNEPQQPTRDIQQRRQQAPPIALPGSPRLLHEVPPSGPGVHAPQGPKAGPTASEAAQLHRPRVRRTTGSLSTSAPSGSVVRNLRVGLLAQRADRSRDLCEGESRSASGRSPRGRLPGLHKNATPWAREGAGVDLLPAQG
jgi:hypothetical protein